MTERPVRFRLRGIDSSVSEAEWPENLPLPPEDCTVIEMPNHLHKGIALDRNNDYIHCLRAVGGYAWTLADIPR